MARWQCPAKRIPHELPLFPLSQQGTKELLRYALFPASDLSGCAKHLFLKDVARHLHNVSPDGVPNDGASERRQKKMPRLWGRRRGTLGGWCSVGLDRPH